MKRLRLAYACAAVAITGFELAWARVGERLDCDLQNCRPYIVVACAAPLLVLLGMVLVLGRNEEFGFREQAKLAFWATFSFSAMWFVYGAMSHDQELSLGAVFLLALGFPVSLILVAVASSLVKALWPRRRSSQLKNGASD